MSLKTSFFNKTLFKSDIKRYWWISALETLMLIIFFVVPFYNNCQWAYNNGEVTVYKSLESIAIISILVSFGTAVILFTFMHFNNSISTIHSLPIKRITVFSTKLISGIVLIVCPLIIMSAVLGIMSLGKVMGSFIGFYDILECFYKGFIYSLIIFSLTILVNMMTGNPIGTVVFTVGFIFLPLWINTILSTVFEYEILGFTSQSTQKFLEYLYIGPNGITDKGYVFMYPVLSLIFTISAYVLYKMRKSESHGEVITFKWLTPVFIGIIATLASGLGYVYASEIFDTDTLFSLLPFGIFGTVVAYMIYKKSLMIKGLIKPILIYILSALVFIGIVEFDITGFEKRIPKTEDIKSVSITSYGSGIAPMFTDTADIEQVEILHKYLVEQGKRDTDNRRNMLISYKLKNNKTLLRNYEIDLDIDEKFLKPLFETEEYKKAYFTTLSKKNNSFTEIHISDRRRGGEFIYYPDDSELLSVVSAVKKDMLSFPYTSFNKDGNSSTIVTLYWNEQDKVNNRVYQNSETFFVDENSKNTNEFLKKAGFFSGFPTKDNLKEANLRMCLTKDDKNLMEIKITESEKIWELYSIYDEMLSGNTFKNYEQAINVYITYTLKNGHCFDISCTYDIDKLPPMLSEYLK